MFKRIPEGQRRLSQGRAGKQRRKRRGRMSGGYHETETCSTSAPGTFFTHTVASNCCQPCELCEKQTLALSILSLLSLLSPSFFSSSICTDCHYENLKPLKKVMISSCGKGHGKLTGTGEDKTSAFNKRFYDPQKLVFALQQSHLPPAAGVHLGNKVQTTVLCSIHFLDQ